MYCRLKCKECYKSPEEEHFNQELERKSKVGLDKFSFI